MNNKDNMRERFEKWYETITPAIPYAGYEDMTMDAAYLAWKEAESRFQKVEQSKTNGLLYKKVNDCYIAIDSTPLFARKD